MMRIMRIFRFSWLKCGGRKMKKLFDFWRFLAHLVCLYLFQKSSGDLFSFTVERKFPPVKRIKKVSLWSKIKLFTEQSSIWNISIKSLTVCLRLLLLSFDK